VALAVYSTIQSQQGEILKGYAIHNLYQNPRDLSLSQLVMDYPVDFFLGAVELKAGIIIPTPRLQQKLLLTLEQGLNQQLHNPQYSIIANPFSPTFQNCTEHLLDLLFAAIYSTDSLAQIKANQRAYFKPQDIEISPFKRLLAPVFNADIHMQDQGKSIQVATFSTIGRFMLHNQLTVNISLLEPDKTGLSVKRLENIPARASLH